MLAEAVVREVLPDVRVSRADAVPLLSPDEAEDLLDRIGPPKRELPAEPSLSAELATGSLDSRAAGASCVRVELPILWPTLLRGLVLRCVRVADTD